MNVGPEPRRGDVWVADLDPAIGHEQGKGRPVLVVSHDRFNRADNGLCIVVALTRTDRGLPFHVRVRPPEGGLDTPSVVQCEQIRIASFERLVRYRGRIGDATLAAVDARIRRILDLS